MHASAVQLIPYGDDPLATLATRLLAEHAERLPRLEGVVVLLPEPSAAPRLRQLLLQQAATLGLDALLGPHITTLREWLNALPLNIPQSIVSDDQRPLILVEALREHQSLFGNANLWALADSLLALFDELTLNRVELPQDLTDFTRAVASGYGLGDDHPKALEREAHLVHTLWHAWHQQLHGRGLVDQHTRYLLQLSASLQLPVKGKLYMAGLPIQSLAERQWLTGMVEGERLTLLLHGEAGAPPAQSYHPRTPLLRLLNALPPVQERIHNRGSRNALFEKVYTPDDDPLALQQRAREFARNHPDSPVGDSIELFHADGDETEARAVELQVRLWLLEGHSQIGIITENRRLARRLRALLERSEVALHDSSGWALSTTSAAATLEQWLQCVEEDFHHRAMLDLLKSPFIFHGEEREAHLNRVYRLEQDIVLHENIAGGLQRYLRQTEFRQHRLPANLAAGLDGVADLLQRLRECVAPLTPLLSGHRPASHYLSALLQSLPPLGLEQGLAADAAGAQLLDTLQQLHQAVHDEHQALSWLEFRGWLGRILEHSHFRLNNRGGAVTLMGLGQSQLQQFDALIIAGMERELLPGSPTTSPFFNDAVRRELHLPTGDEQQAERFYHFRRLLESSPRLLLTLRRQQDGEEIIPSPWLAALRSFHQLAYGSNLEALQLSALLKLPPIAIGHEYAPLPAPAAMPQPTLPAPLLPRRYSASAYQQLINCPYQFYAARGLGLAPPDEIRQALEKSDYGERVHQILQAFHSDMKGLPGPFCKRLEMNTLAEGQQLLESISQAVFARDLEDNFLHRGWLQRWLERIPDYLAWQMEREQSGRVEEVELEITTEGFDPTLELSGRLDRVDRRHQAHAVVDYKTGATATAEEVLSGEAVQLPFYALLAQYSQYHVEQVEYLALDGRKVESRSTLQGDELNQLRDETAERLRTLQREMEAAVVLPAWGDEGVCGYCQMEGVCRRGSWPLGSVAPR
ncbi:MAG: PD-(D/E)XK nuclease family protein [Chromatiales bacterium]|nr:PD-(D/E)XK nuclease family protein [Chromatiales bacterium]